MKRTLRPGPLLTLLAVGLLLTALAPAPARSQVAYTGRNAYIPAGRNLTSAMVSAELERRLARNPGNEASLWNTGYDFYRNFPRNQDTARAIKDGFLSVRAANPAQRAILLKAAIHWEKIHDYGVTNVPVAQNLNNRRKIYYGDTSKAATLARRAPGSRHRGYPSYDWPGRFINKREPYRGRADNPYPGKYFSGMYPP